MNKFKEWLWEKDFNRLVIELFDCYLTVNEVLQANMPSDIEVAKKRLLNHIKYRHGNISLDPVVVINNIRHLFTTYDNEWKKFEKIKTNSDSVVPLKFIHPLTRQTTNFDVGDMCGQIEYWNTLVQATYDLVDHIILLIAKPQNHKAFKQANQDWLNKKLRVTC